MTSSFFRLNTLYVYEKYGDEYPQNFWLLNTTKEMTHLDAEEFILEIVFDCEILLLKFPTLQNLQIWQKFLMKAQNFQAETYFSNELKPEVHSVFISMDSQMLLTFIMDARGQICKKNLLFLTDILEVKIKDLKPECTLVVKNEDIWRLNFDHYCYCAQFVALLERLWLKKK